MDAAVNARAAPWPDVVWEAAFLRGLDARARAEIEAAGRVRPMRRGDVLFRAGEPADALYVVIEGACSLAAVRRGEADASIIRQAARGETFGEEATVVAFAVRQAEARCDEPGAVAEVPLSVLRRAMGRAGGGEQTTRLERALRRAATMDLLRTTSFTRVLAERDLEVLLDAVQHVTVARGEHVYRQGDVATSAYLVADGLLQAQSDDDGKPRVEAYIARGDLFGDDELEGRSNRRVAVVASGPTWLLAIPRDVFLVIARRNAPALEGVRRVRVDAVPPAARAGGATTNAHVFQDLYRMRVARSLLVIDQDSCVRCGHCAWSCASTHDDGISRLVRRGDKVVVQRPDEGPLPGEDVVARVVRLAKEVSFAPLLVPNSCQHCKNPSCMIDCPTGAIGRDARGEVFIREDLCTGCGSCAKACPWDNIQIAPRAKIDPKVPYPDVAVKCDLCAGAAAGPACVASCPVQAITRIDPNEALVELRNAPRALATSLGLAAAPGPALPARTGAPAVGRGLLLRRLPAWPWTSGAALAASGLAFANLPRMASGVLAGALVVLLVAYAGAKRSPRLLARIRAPGPLARVLYIGHLALGVLALGITTAHTHAAAPGNVAGALTLAMAIALATGGFGALVHAFLPPRLARLERGSVLPEELVARRREIDERIFTRLSGRSEVVKTLYGRVLRPYRASFAGPVLLAVSGRPLREEEEHVRARAVALLAGRSSERLEGLDELVRLVVEHRAVGSLRLLTFVLRGWLPVHLAATGTALVLLAAHLVAVLVRR